MVKEKGSSTLVIIPYAGRTGTRVNLDALRRHGWRLLVSAAGRLKTEGFRYALDNGAWTAHQQGRPFDEQAFERALTKLGRDADWVSLPDIVAGGHASLDLSLRWMGRVLSACNHALLPVQDGMSLELVRPHVGGNVGIFVGGSTDWKIATIDMWADFARSMGIWCHVARVNSVRRIQRCVMAGATSFDGTGATRRVERLPPLANAARQAALPFERIKK